LAGAEELRDASLRETMQGRGAARGVADQPVPRDILWTPHQFPDSSAEVVVEPIAMHVPEECFYIRFGEFDNYLWFNKLLQEYGGDLGRMIAQRGHTLRLNERMQRQLSLRQSALADLLGEHVLADVAIVGHDAFLREGAAIGILLHAKNNLAISTDINRQRGEALMREAGRGASVKSETIAARPVSFLSTPDNRIRSYYAVDGDFHLVTTCRQLVERFFAAGAGDRPLGATAEFRHARRLMPVERKDTIFAYFSTAFFRDLLSPRYQVELSRRMAAVSALELVQLARLAAKQEGVQGESIDQLVAEQLLPSGIARLADGSGPFLEENRVLDSLRGARGSFLPIPDVDLQKVTSEEAAVYAERAKYYQENWRQLDPIMIGMQRQDAGADHRERLAVDARISPLGVEKYGWLLSLLGPPHEHRMVFDESSIVTAQAFVTGGLLAPVVPPHYLFLAVEDEPLVIERAPRRLLDWFRLLRLTPGYLGAWPKPGFLDQVPGWLASPPDEEGFSQLPLNVWRWQGEQFSLLSFHRDLLARVGPAMGVQRVEDPAQMRVRVADLSSAQVATSLKAISYQRGLQASVGNVRLMHNLSQQLDVPRAEALQVANQLLDTTLVCPLGGEYQAVPSHALPVLRSSRWPAGDETAIPGDHPAPLLKWFRGLDLAVNKYPDRLEIHAELEMQREKAARSFDFPTLGIFGGKKAEPSEQAAGESSP
jgi:hypothetical protein